jgi:peptidyl-tRNA hydrolase
MENPIIYVVLNKELNMSAGKAAAQAVHASLMLKNNVSLFAEHPKRTVIVLEADNESQIRNLSEYLNIAGIANKYYIDEGVNEVGAYSITALAVEAIYYQDEKTREMFASFKLFGSKPDLAHTAWSTLSEVINSGDGYYGVPWYVRRTLGWITKK